MANAHIVVGVISRGQPVMDASTLMSNTIANNGTYLTPTGPNFVEVTAMDADIWIAFNSANTANAGTNPRYYLPQSTKVSVSCKANTSIHMISVT